jgi:hypothetical protein
LPSAARLSGAGSLSADLDAETREEDEVEIPLRPGAGSMIGSGTVPASEEVRAAERRRVEQPL